MKRLLLLTCLGIFGVSLNADARVITIEDWRGGDFVNAGNDDGNGQGTCESRGWLSERPTNKHCDTVIENNLTCYNNCHCNEEFELCNGAGEEPDGIGCVEDNGDQKYSGCKCGAGYKSCTDGQVGSGEACTADGGEKYSTCSCPSIYDQACDGTGEIGVGTSCDGFYSACKCNSEYQEICSAAVGLGEACAADGVNKYSACDWGQYDGVSCRAVTDATPYYNSSEYVQHANAFQGIENTKAILESQGEAALPAYAAVNFHPAHCVDKNHQYLGIGKWYLPSAGEMLYLSGTDFNNMSSIADGTGVIGNNATVVRNAMKKMWQKTGSFGAYVHVLEGGLEQYLNGAPDVWTSSKSWDNYPYWWQVHIHPQYLFSRKASQGYSSDPTNGSYNISWNRHTIRPVLMLQNCFNDNNISVGSVLFSDMSIGSADDTLNPANCARKVPVGVVYWISPDKTLVRVISVKNATYLTDWSFDPDDPASPMKLNDHTSIFRVPWLLPEKNDFNSNDQEVAAVPEDTWGCTAISPDDANCSNEPRRHKAMTCTPDDGSTEFAQYANAFRGREYTDAIIAQHGSNSAAAYKASKFYPTQDQYPDYKHMFKNAPFTGQGKWYLPSAGEMLYLNGSDFNSMSGITDAVGVGTNLTNIENVLGNIAAYTADGKIEGTQASYWAAGCSTFAARSPRVWTSSEVDAENAYYFDATDGTIKITNKMNPKDEQGNSISINTRPVIMLHNFGFSRNKNPQVGDILTSDMSLYGLQGYYSHFAYSLIYPIGVVYWVSPDKNTVRVVSCKPTDGKWLSSGDPVDIEAIPNNIWDSVPEGQSLVFGDLHDGRKNTQAAVDQIGANALIPYVATQFYAPGVAADDANFGQGKWYVPAIGEWMDLYGYNWNAVAEYVSEHGYYEGNSAAIGDNFATVNAALTALGSSVATTAVSIDPFATSSEYSGSHDELHGIMMGFNSDDGRVSGSEHGGFTKSSSVKLRVSALLENRFRLNAVKPVVGDVMYADLSYGSADEYDGSKTAVGVVYWVSSDGGSARIINLKNLTVKRIDGAVGYEYTFNPNIPYTQNASAFPWEWHNGVSHGSSLINTDITGIKDLRNNWASSLSNRNAGTSFKPDCQ